MNDDIAIVPGWPDYLVTTQGKVWSIKRRRFMSQHPNISGYARVHVRSRGLQRQVAVHSLVLRAFVGPRPPGMEGCHNNGNLNDNRLENLRWDTQEQNLAERNFHK